MAVARRGGGKGAAKAAGAKPAAVTLRAVAERAGVTAATVSYILRGHQQRMGITDACAERVRTAAGELGYRGHYHAQALAVGRAMTLGLAVGSGPVSVLRSPFWSPIASGVESEARARGYDLLLIGGFAAMEPQARALDQLAQRRIDALIVLRGIFPELLPELQRPDCPAVVIGAHDGERVHQVRVDAAPGYAEALAHLAGLRHRGVLWLGEHGPGAPPYAAERERLCRAAAATAGIAFAAVRLQAPPLADAREIERYRAAIAAGPRLPAGITAVICQSDLLALALCAELAAQGVRVPQQVSVIGFDDLYAENAIPALTTISQALPEQGRAAVAAVVDLVEGRSGAPAVRRVPAFLVPRASTALAARA